MKYTLKSSTYYLDIRDQHILYKMLLVNFVETLVYKADGCLLNIADFHHQNSIFKGKCMIKKKGQFIIAYLLIQFYISIIETLLCCIFGT